MVIRYAFLVQLFFTLSLFGQGESIQLEADPSFEILVCGPQKTLTFTIKNEGVVLTSPEIKVGLSEGMEYVDGSFSEITSKGMSVLSTLQDSALTFSCNTLSNGDSVTFTIDMRATMAAIDFQNQGNVFRNVVTLSAGSFEESINSPSYNILYPVLSLMNITPKNQTIYSGESSSRVINIMNGGNGKVDRLILVDISNSTDLTIDSVDIGVISGDSIIIQGSDFNSIGNGDDYFDQYETINITEYLTGISCSDVTVSSTFNTFWGCDGVLRQGPNNSYSNVTIEYQNPNLRVTSSNSLESCFGAGTPSQQQVIIYNSGNGVAANVTIDIFKSTGGSYNQNILSKFDVSSIRYQTSLSGALQPLPGLTTFSTTNSGIYSCLGSDPKGRFIGDLPDMAPGDSIIVTWDMISCCITTCNNDKVKGWKGDLDYENLCATNSYNKDISGQGVNNQIMSFFTETPVDVHATELATYFFTVSSFSNTLPQGEGARYKVEISLEDDLQYSSLKFHSNGVVWTPISVNYNASTDIVTAYFPSPAPFTVPKSVLELEVLPICGQTGWKTVTLDVSYQPDTTCVTCEIPLECDVSVQSYLHCPGTGCEGPKVVSSVITRTSLGSPDNNLDGLPDNGGSLNMSEVRLDRAMTGDTMLFELKSVIQGTSATWSYGEFEQTVDYGSVLSVNNAQVIIYDASQATYFSVSNVSVSSNQSGNQNTFTLDLDANSLAALNVALSGYQYEVGDSLEIEIEYRVTDNVPGLIKETTFLNDLYLSTVSSPSVAQQDNCYQRNCRATLIGYQFRNNSPNNVTINSCSKSINQNFGLSIGDLASNYAGGNLFPYEYRHWGTLKEVWMVIPDNYSHVNTVIKYWRTRRTNSNSGQTLNNITPDAINGDTLYFDLQQYFDNGSLILSDDGWNGRMQVEIAPNCFVPTNTYENVSWIYNYQKASTIDGNETGNVLASSPDRVRYQPSNFTIISENPWQDANQRNVVWDLKLKNNSNSAADYSFVSFDFPSNIQIDSIINDANGSKLNQQNDIFMVGTVNGNATANLSVYGQFSNCDTVLFTAYAGNECTGYPTDFASFSCGYDSYVLYVEPKSSYYQTRITSELLPDPCSPEVILTTDITSVRIAHMYDMQIEFLTSDTTKIKIKPGSSEFQYNTSNAYESVPDPNYGSGLYSFDINQLEPAFVADGIPGILDLSNNQYRLKTTIVIGDQFVIGDFIQIRIKGQNACDVDLQDVNLAYDPNSKFSKDNTAGLHMDIGNSWSASWGDYDNDGYDDLFVPTNDITEPNILYHNNGDGTFTKVTSGAIVTDLGSSISGTWGDFDNDGFLDLFVANNVNSKNKLYHNNGDGTFTSITNNPVVDEGIYSHSASWADINGDGNLDIVVSDFHPTHFNSVFIGDGNGGFTNDASSPFALSSTSAVGVAWGDFDNDFDLDLFVANTNGENNQLFRNVDGQLVEVTSGPVVTDGGNSVGGVWGDYDNDGDLDLFVTNSSINDPNFFYENNGDGTFTRNTSLAITNDQGHSHGASWIDFDNDGDQDLLIANNQNSNNFLFSNNGNGTFTKLVNAITEEENDSYGTAWSDFDNDGDYDLFISNIGQNVNDFYVNEKGSCTNHIKVRLNGCNSNKFGIGAMIRVKANIRGNDVWQTKHISTQTSAMGGQNSSTLLFGLSDATAVDSMTVLWPSGIVTYVVNPTINQLHTIDEECGSKVCGTVFHDENSNGVQDNDEIAIPGSRIVIQPGDKILITNNDGYFEAYLDDGSYSLTQDLDSPWVQVYPLSNQGYSLSINSSVSTEYCGNDFGNTSNCLSSDLELLLGTTAFRRGLPNMMNINIANTSVVDASSQIEIRVKVSDNIFMTDSLWSLETDSASHRIYSYYLDSLGALSDTTFELTDSVGLSSNLNDLVYVEVNLLTAEAECDVTNNQATFSDIVVGSIDPNDKLVFVNGIVNRSYANFSDEIMYKIRFQNVGTFPAQIVRIEDQLSDLLDWESFRPGANSHEFDISMDNGKLTWLNTNINLADSNSNEEESHGYVTFYIKPKSGIDQFSLIQNTANIQFDYNEFIHTNTVEIFVGDGMNSDDFYLFSYPNPTNGLSKIMCIRNQNEVMNISVIELNSSQGQQLLNLSDVDSYEYFLDLNILERGVYIVRATDDNGNVYIGRVVKN